MVTLTMWSFKVVDYTARYITILGTGISFIISEMHPLPHTIIHTNVVILTKMININFSWEKLEGKGNVMNLYEVFLLTL